MTEPSFDERLKATIVEVVRQEVLPALPKTEDVVQKVVTQLKAEAEQHRQQQASQARAQLEAAGANPGNAPQPSQAGSEIVGSNGKVNMLGLLDALFDKWVKFDDHRFEKMIKLEELKIRQSSPIEYALQLQEKQPALAGIVGAILSPRESIEDRLPERLADIGAKSYYEGLRAGAARGDGYNPFVRRRARSEPNDAREEEPIDDEPIESEPESEPQPPPKGRTTAASRQAPGPQPRVRFASLAGSR